MFDLHPRSPQLSPAELEQRLADPAPPFLLDVRQPEEFAGGHLPGSRLVPLSELAVRLDELPSDREIVCICRSGSRSGAAARLLQERGYRALNLAGGMLAWRGPVAR